MTKERVLDGGDVAEVPANRRRPRPPRGFGSPRARFPPHCRPRGQARRVPGVGMAAGPREWTWTPRRPALGARSPRPRLRLRPDYKPRSGAGCALRLSRDLRAVVRVPPGRDRGCASPDLQVASRRGALTYPTHAKAGSTL